jgi:hypothetical protein
MNGAMMPEQLPIVNCMPVAVVLFPYLGELLGSWDDDQHTRIHLLHSKKTYPGQGKTDCNIQPTRNEETPSRR